MFIDGKGVADAPPSEDAPSARESLPRITVQMAARIQGWTAEDGWTFSGRKTAQYRQIGNAFPPPVARALGERIAAALRHEGEPREAFVTRLHDPIYRALATSREALSLEDLIQAYNEGTESAVQRGLAALRRDFEVEEVVDHDGATRYRLGAFRGFTGQSDHARHEQFDLNRNRVS